MTLHVSRNGSQYSVSPEDFHAEVKDDDTYVLSATDDTPGVPSVGNLIDIDTYDTSFKLLRITALILKFVNHTRQPMQRRKNMGSPIVIEDNSVTSKSPELRISTKTRSSA